MLVSAHRYTCIQFVIMTQLLIGNAHKVVPINEDRRRKLNMTSGAGYMEVNVNTKSEVHIYVMLALQCMHDNLLKRYSF